jgi:hypothetical protein
MMAEHYSLGSFTCHSNDTFLQLMLMRTGIEDLRILSKAHYVALLPNFPC